MRTIVNKQINENKSASQEIKTDEINGLIEINGDTQKTIKSKLAAMDRDCKSSEETHKTEPETKVKKTVYRTLTNKFRDVLRGS